MKTKHKITLVIGFFCFGLIMNSCDRDKPNSLRDKYLGKYQVKETIYCYGPCDTCSSEKDTVITISCGLTDSTLHVLGKEVFVDSTGTYYSYHYGLRFWGDSISSTFMNGGLGCGQYETYIGCKISNNP